MLEPETVDSSLMNPRHAGIAGLGTWKCVLAHELMCGAFQHTDDAVARS